MIERYEHSAEKEALVYESDPKFLRSMIYRHRATTELCNVMQAIEFCGCSPELTYAINSCSILKEAIHDLLDERDKLKSQLNIK